ncbi:MAG: helix-turn-helix transcriptional regulator [Caulobacterales bacterium]
MPRSVFTDAYSIVLKTLLEAREAAGLTQIDLAARLDRPQPFISKVERGVRRLDIVEFYAWARAIGEDPAALFARIAKKLPKKVDI